MYIGTILVLDTGMYIIFNFVASKEYGDWFYA